MEWKRTANEDRYITHGHRQKCGESQREGRAGSGCRGTQQGGEGWDGGHL